MRIAIGSDHAGFELKGKLIAFLKEQGLEVVDCGCNGPESVHYPVYGKAVAEKVQKGESDFGILICFTGIGMSMVANRYEGVRAALCRSCDEAFMTRQHNDANILVLGAKYTFQPDAFSIAMMFLKTPFSGGERHALRIKMIEKE